MVRREPEPAVRGCLILGGVAAIGLLLLGIAVPLAGGTDFNGVLRRLGSLLVMGVWIVALVAAARARRWGWTAALTLTGPLPLLAYSMYVSGSFDSPDAWATFADPPWELLTLTLSPLPALVYAVQRAKS